MVVAVECLVGLALVVWFLVVVRVLWLAMLLLGLVVRCLFVWLVGIGRFVLLVFC